MKKIFSVLLVVCMVLILAPLSVDAWNFSEVYDCESTYIDPSDSSRKITDCNITIENVEVGELDNVEETIVVKYNKPTDKSDFEIIDATSGLYDDIQKTSDGGIFKFTFAEGLSGEITAFKIRFYSDKSLTGKDCGGNVGRLKEDGKTDFGTTGGNTDAENSETGVSAPVIILGVGIVACLVVYASTSKKTKMHRI